MQKVRVCCKLWEHRTNLHFWKVCIKHIWIMGHNGWNNVNNNSAQCKINVCTQYTSPMTSSAATMETEQHYVGSAKVIMWETAVQGRKYAKKLREINSLWGRVIELVLSGATETSLHASILPQPLDDSRQLARHVSLVRGAGQNKQLPCVILQNSQSNASFSGFPFDTLALHK